MVFSFEEKKYAERAEVQQNTISVRIHIPWQITIYPSIESFVYFFTL